MSGKRSPRGRTSYCSAAVKFASRAYCSWFGFRGSDQQKPVGKLSGGERNRVHLAKLLKEGGNVLLLDEPTNDLDVDTLRSLEEALLEFAGCAVVISHDRWFLDRISTHILAFEGSGQATFYEGNYQAYEARPTAATFSVEQRASESQIQQARTLTSKIMLDVDMGYWLSTRGRRAQISQEIHGVLQLIDLATDQR